MNPASFNQKVFVLSLLNTEDVASLKLLVDLMYSKPVQVPSNRVTSIMHIANLLQIALEVAPFAKRTTAQPAVKPEALKIVHQQPLQIVQQKSVSIHETPKTKIIPRRSVTDSRLGSRRVVVEESPVQPKENRSSKANVTRRDAVDEPPVQRKKTKENQSSNANVTPSPKKTRRSSQLVTPSQSSSFGRRYSRSSKYD